ncbi:hypothetical protein NC652_015697 [Populus alba x Populus x berolinensis]|nr:hypothetical protein NC652_015697 [Populus alba x Populus x berolinensis]
MAIEGPALSTSKTQGLITGYEQQYCPSIKMKIQEREKEEQSESSSIREKKAMHTSDMGRWNRSTGGYQLKKKSGGAPRKLLNRQSG